MSEDQQDDKRTINSGTGVRVSVGALAGLVLGFGLYLFAEIQRLHAHLDDEISDVRAMVATKADKAQAGDRYTGSTAKADKEAYQAAHEALRREYLGLHEAQKREINHIHDMMDGKQ